MSFTIAQTIWTLRKKSQEANDLGSKLCGSQSLTYFNIYKLFTYIQLPVAL